MVSGVVDRARTLMARINAQLPTGVDWKAGARTYFAQAQAEAPDPTWMHRYLRAKPFCELGQGGRARDEFVELLQNFVNVFALLDLRPPARILDVACGSGWLSHYYHKLGFDVLGIDISADAVGHAKARVGSDPDAPRGDLDAMFRVHDIEADRLDADGIDAAIFESCLHHMENPVAALEHVAAALSERGVIVLIEGENRAGPLKPEYVAEMARFGTIERPYARAELVEILHAAGLPYFEFFGTANGWYRAGDAGTLPEAVRLSEQARNFAVCAPSEEALRRVAPAGHIGVAGFDLIEGFSAASEPACPWAAPFARFRTSRAHAGLTLQIGSPVGGNHVRVYCGGSETEFTCDVNRVQDVDLGDVAAGTQVFLCADAMFVPAWTSGNDQRPLSFWVRFPTAP